MIKKAWIQEQGSGRLEPEGEDLRRVLTNRGVEVCLFTPKLVQRGRIPLDSETFVAGDHGVMPLVFRKMGFQPRLSCYPTCLREHLQRRVREGELRELFRMSDEELYWTFLKPAYQPKLFTGFVPGSGKALYALRNLSGKTRVFFSEVVRWRAEFRVYVLRSRVVGLRQYLGEEGAELDMGFVEAAIRSLEDSEERTASYGIDFGVLEDGKTSLIEWNDGYALGSYGLDAEVYTDMLLARWEEIVGEAAW